MKGNDLMAKSKKKKEKYGNPQKNIEAQRAAEEAVKEVERAMMEQKARSDKPMLMRILVLAVAAVMILGVVVAAVFGG